jgi:general secretion pathway protein I
MRKKSNKKGFTLLEVLIALAIVGGLLVAIIESVNYNLSVVDRHEALSTSLMLAKQKIIDIQTSPQRAKGNFDPPFEDYSYEADIGDGPVPGLAVLVLTVKKGHDATTMKVFLRK